MYPMGKRIAKVPNGASPFARHFQNGDITHISSLNLNSLKQICNEAGLDLLSCKNSYRTSSNKFINKFKASMAFFFRDILEILIGYIYYGERIPLDPNLTAIIIKK